MKNPEYFQWVGWSANRRSSTKQPAKIGYLAHRSGYNLTVIVSQIFKLIPYTGCSVIYYFPNKGISGNRYHQLPRHTRYPEACPAPASCPCLSSCRHQDFDTVSPVPGYRQQDCMYNWDGESIYTQIEQHRDSRPNAIKDSTCNWTK